MKITRGDTKRLKFQRRKRGTLEPITTIPDKLYFTVKYSENDDDFIFQKTLDNDIKFNAEDNYYYFTIKPSDTDNLPYINLFYDLQVNEKGVKKTIATGSLNVTEEVTFVSNESEYNAQMQDDSDLCAEEIVTIEETDVIMNTDYEELDNKPSINNVTLQGNKTSDDLNLVAKVIEVDKGTSAILNTDTGGQLLFLTKDKKRANVSVNDGEADIYVQLSSTDTDTNEGARITLDSNKAYYTSGNTYKFNPEDEIVTKKDIPNTSDYITKSVDDLDNYELKDNVGNKLELSINPDTYVITANLKNSAGTTISTQEVDLPLEEMVVNASYDNENKEIVLNLKSGSTTKVPIADLVSGLATTDDLMNYTKTTDLQQDYLQKKDLKEPFKEISGDSINVWELEEGNYVTTEKANIYLQTGSSIEFNPRTMIIVSDKEDGKKQYEIIDNTGKVYTGSVANDGTPEENGNYSLDISKTITYDNDFEYEVKENFNPAHKQYVDSEVGDCYYTLDKNINEENDKQTIVNINAKDGSYSQLLCVDSLDITQEVPTIDVLSANKGRDLNQRLSVLETKNVEEDTRIGKLEKEPLQVIEIDSEMSEDGKSSHTYPQLELSEDQVKVVMENNISVLKVHYNITGRSSGTETDTLVFYTTIDDENVVSGANIVHTIKINAIRRNDEGILVYHGEMVGNGKEYYTKVDLVPTWKE